MIDKRFFLAGIYTLGAALLTSFAPPLHQHKKNNLTDVAAPANLTMYWIDTEGGAATLIVTPAGESVLIDSGNPGGRDANRIVKVAREVAGLKQIDHLVTTHWHKDHYGGAAEVAQQISIGELHDKGIPDNLREDANFADNIKPYRQIAVQKRTQLKPNTNINLKRLAKGLPNLNLRVVGADKKFVPVAAQVKAGTTCAETTTKAEDTSDNANSLVLVMDYGPFRFFDGGDLTWNVEKTLVCPQNLIGTVDVYQVNHHGLDQSNNPILIKNLAPTVSIMNNGTRKGCGPQTVTALRQTPSIQAAYQVHKNIREDAEFNTQEEYIANLEENCQANFIKLTVAPDGKKYTVSIPAKNHEKTFTTKLNR